MYSDYRFLAKGVAKDDKVFTELEASTYKLASRNNNFYEICFLARPISSPTNELKFIRDDEFVNINKVSILKSNMPEYKKYSQLIDKFLEKTKTPTLAQLKNINEQIINAQEKLNSKNLEIELGL